MSVDWISSIVQIVLVNVVLSGDNAIVVALAAHNVPPEQRTKAMLWGTCLAIGMRLVLTFAVSYLLMIPGLRFVGAVLLAYIACKLIQEEVQSAEPAGAAATSIGTAIARIALADLVMSLDNVIAVAGLAQCDPLRLIIGLALSITMILALSRLIVAIMNRYRWIVYAGTAVLALAAADMMQQDIEVIRPQAFSTSHHAGAVDFSGWPFRLVLVSICLSSSYWWPRDRLKAASATRER
jgi:YjbE family integral membrane protein